ncbi:MAG: asparagine--tRNA ligase [Clostridia bacterium]|nr:asparagine--tRNA ligase [Clostridia bacterium]
MKQIFVNPEAFGGKTVTVCGWARTIRDSKSFGFIELNDGSYFKNCQIVFDRDKVVNYDEIAKQNVGACLTVTGKLILTPENKQPFEINADEITVLGTSTPDYPLQKKRHTLEFLRSIPHLRPRTNTFNAVFKIRSEAAFAIHSFFNERGFVYVHTPIITGSDCEGAGAMFQVTTLDLDNVNKLDDGTTDYKQDFFGKKASLTVSGQLDVENFAMAYSNVYTFGPTFRAEHSNTVRHAAEFWMIEPELAFADLSDDMDCAEDMVKYIIERVMSTCEEEIKFLNQFVDNGLIERLNNVKNNEFKRLTYTEAIEILEKVKDKFDAPVYWGCDLQSEHERYITEQVFKKPVFLTDYPKEIKAFYMRLNDDKKTVAASDLLVPGIGELIGGSQREERMEILQARMAECGLNAEEYKYYLDLRKYGGVIHSGFGLGFERMIMYLTGISNIRDVLPFPRTVGTLEN